MTGMPPQALFDWYPLTNLRQFRSEPESGDVFHSWPPLTRIEPRRWYAECGRDGDSISRVPIDSSVIREMTTSDGIVFMVWGGQPWADQMADLAKEINAAAEAVASRTIL